MQVMHIWEKYLPGLFDETHPYCLSQDPESSFLVAARFVDSAIPLKNTSTMEVQKRRVATNPTVLERILLRLKSRSFWTRFNRFCLKEFKRLQPTVIHCHFGNTAAKVLPFLNAADVPVIVSFYGNDASESLQRKEFKKLYPQLFQRASKVLVLCQEVAQRLEAVGCPPEKLVQYQLPAGIEKYPYQPRTVGKTIRFITCARFVEKKGYPLLFKVFRQLLEEGMDATLTIIGYGPLKPSFQAMGIHETSHPVRMIDTELAPDFAKAYYEALKQHDIFVLPSTRAANGDDEGGPALTLICAQAAGLPVICSDFPGSEISVQDGVTGLIVPQDNADALREKMRLLAKDPDFWNPLGKNGSDKVQSLFSLEGQMSKVLQLYKVLSFQDDETMAIHRSVIARSGTVEATS